MARSVLLAALLLAAMTAGRAPAQDPYDFADSLRADVPISIQHETTFGTSVFVKGGLAPLGGSAASKALRLSPADYPLWRVAVSLPRGEDVTLAPISRSDAPGDLASDANETAILTPLPYSTPAKLDARTVRVSVRTSTSAQTLVLDRFNGERVGSFLPTTTTPTGWMVFDVPRVLDAQYRLTTLVGQPLSGYLPLAAQRSYVLNDAGVGFEAREYPYAGSLSARTIRTTDQITSTILGNSRTLRVYLPRGYDTFPTRIYPVIYMHDGQNIFRPGGPFGTWAIEDALDAGIRSGAIPEMIVVGIDNNANRLREYMPPYQTYQGQPGQGDQYARFIVEEVIPFIEARYRVSRSAEERAIAGSSLGGLISMYIGWEHPDVFGRVASFSGSFWLDEIVDVVAAGPARPIRIYLDSGNTNYDSTTTGNPDSIEDTIGLRNILLGLGYVIGRDLHHTIGYGDMHNEPAWQRRAPGMLRALFPLEEWSRRDGDVNGNGFFEIGDLVAGVNLKNGAESSTTTATRARAYADTEGDGDVDLDDVVSTANALLGIE
jgi:enterochelin esterase-like enzyme